MPNTYNHNNIRHTLPNAAAKASMQKSANTYIVTYTMTNCKHKIKFYELLLRHFLTKLQLTDSL